MRNVLILAVFVALVMAGVLYSQEVTVLEPQPGTTQYYYNYAMPTLNGHPTDFNSTTARTLNAVVGNAAESLAAPSGCKRVGVFSSDVVLNWGNSAVVAGTSSAWLATDTMHYFCGTETDLDAIYIIGRTATGGVLLYYFDK
jgi:hypothetical protein